MKYRLIDAEKPHHAVSRLARALGVSRSGYHAWRRRKPSAHSLADAALRERIEAIHESSRGVYGAPRVHAELALGHGVQVGRKRVARLMREANLAGASRCRRRRTAPRIATAQVPREASTMERAGRMACLAMPRAVAKSAFGTMPKG